MRLLLGVSLAFAVVSSASSAQDLSLLQQSRSSPEPARAAWTPEMFASAEPLGPVALLSEKDLAEALGRQVRSPQLLSPGALPKERNELETSERQLFPVEWLSSREPFPLPFPKDQGPAK